MFCIGNGRSIISYIFFRNFARIIWILGWHSIQKKSHNSASPTSDIRCRSLKRNSTCGSLRLYNGSRLYAVNIGTNRYIAGCCNVIVDLHGVPKRGQFHFYDNFGICIPTLIRISLLQPEIFGQTAAM